MSCKCSNSLKYPGSILEQERVLQCFQEFARRRYLDIYLCCQPVILRRLLDSVAGSRHSLDNSVVHFGESFALRCYQIALTPYYRMSACARKKVWKCNSEHTTNSFPQAFYSTLAIALSFFSLSLSFTNICNAAVVGFSSPSFL